jgi:hypothetical protein
MDRRIAFALFLAACTPDGAAPRTEVRADAAPRSDGAASHPADAGPAPADARPADSDPARPDAFVAPDALAPRADAAPPPDALAPRADAAPPDAAPPPVACAPPAGVAPLDTPAGTWTWVPIDGMRCADGSPTGIGVNRAPGGSRRLFVYLIGGGACWDAQSCYDDGRAAYIDHGFGEADFAGLGLGGVWFFDRANPNNAFAGWNQVFVPYCTGDLHAGDRVAQYRGRPTHHVGADNFAALARRLAATFPDAERVVIAGGSAGGYGALFNWARTRAAFPCARVDLVDDSGPPLPPPHLPPALQARWSDAWGLAQTLPPDCPACVADWSRLVPYNLAAAPGARAALLSTMRDGVISSYMGLDGDAFERGIRALLGAVADPRFGAFLVEGDQHVVMAAPAIAGGQDVPTWLRAMEADDPAWGTVGPDPLPRCDTLADCGSCALCAAQGPCADRYAACNALHGCVDAVVCALACRPDDLVCITSCAAPFPGIGDAALALYTCARCEQCPALCGACP